MNSQNHQTIAIHIVSDVVCPWCVVGVYRLLEAIKSFQSVKFALNFHPFQLNPHIALRGKLLTQHWQDKLGMNALAVKTQTDHITQLASELGFVFNYSENTKTYNTLKAHQLLHSKQVALKLQLFKALFTQNLAIDSVKVLAEQGGLVGLDPSQCIQVLEEEYYVVAVQAEIAQVQKAGVHSVPTFIFNQKTSIQGAQSVERFIHHIQALV